MIIMDSDGIFCPTSPAVSVRGFPLEPDGWLGYRMATKIRFTSIGMMRTLFYMLFHLKRANR